MGDLAPAPKPTGPAVRARAVLACAALACALALGACGSSSTSSSAPASSTAAPAASGAAQTLQVRLVNIAFTPSASTARVGTRITWTNADSVDHNVTAQSGAHFRSPTLHAGDSYSFTPRRPGRILYHCTIHPQMIATIVVVA
jgi:plastocyanin